MRNRLNRQYLVGADVRRLRAQFPDMPNVEIANAVGTSRTYVGVLVGQSPGRPLRLCSACRRPLKYDKTLSSYRHGICSACGGRPGHYRSPLIQQVCETCKVIFLRKLAQIRDRQKRGYTKSYCSRVCSTGRQGWALQKRGERKTEEVG